MSDTFDHALDAYESMDAFDYLVDDFGDHEYKPKTCKFCGETDLWWLQIEGNWRLINSDEEIHDCNKEDKDLENDLIEQLKRRLDGADKGNPK